MKPRRQGLLGARTPLILVSSLALVSASLITAGRWMHGPAAVYLWLGNEVREGDVGPSVYDDDLVTAEILRQTNGRVRDIVSPTPPTLALFMAPFAYVKPDVVNRAWAVANVLVASAAVLLTYLAVRWPRESIPLAVLMVAGLLLSAPLQEDLSRGQIYLLTFLSIACSCWAYATRRDWLLGVGLAVALTVKVASVPIWLLLVFERRWRALAWAMALTFGLVVASLKWIQIGTYARWIAVVIPTWLATPKTMVPAYQTVSGLVQHLFRYDPVWNPDPLANVPTIARVGVALVSVVLLAITLRDARQHGSAPALPVFAAATILSVVLQPTAEQYAYITAFIPLVIATRECLRRQTVACAVMIAIAALLIFSPLPYKNSTVWHGTTALLAYPRLYGGLVLWITLIQQRSVAAQLAVE